ncbi:MAG: ABC transporter permease [Clostridium sp.]|nr:ABC transporter permease [Clostridium sp.]MCM1208614.1 ABC transporter permease [Ruminococcus sp.]
MEKYSGLSKLYLKFQKKRTIVTIFGVAVAAGLLFAILTLYFSNFFNERDELRKQADYEIVFFPESAEQAAGIVNDACVKSAYEGRCYSKYNAGYVDGALFINTKNPYRLDKYFKLLSDKYGARGELNQGLATYYLQGDNGNGVYLGLIIFLFIAFIFAIVAVGIIRNSIQLNMQEQIKDYGILRCIGATRKQLKRIIYLMGFFQELAGILIGMVLGFIGAFFIGKSLEIKAGFHIIPVLFVLVAFLGDLAAAMDEMGKLVKKLTPVEAVRGNLKLKKRKLKSRKRGLFGHIFGVEGEYAYKNLMANKGRFYKSIASFGLGIAAFIALSVVISALNYKVKEIERRYGDYQLYYYSHVGSYYDIDAAKSSLPPYDMLEALAKDSTVTAVKQMYVAFLYIADYENYLMNYFDYKDEWYWHTKEDMEKSIKNETPGFVVFNEASLVLFGYDEEEIKEYEELLVDGTLDVSDNGIILTEYVMNDQYFRYGNDKDAYRVHHYKVGDTIDIVDFKRLVELYDEKRGDPGYEPSIPAYEEAFDGLLYQACITELIEQGAYTTYTVEGIVKYNKEKIGELSAILPLENYCAITGLNEADSSGIKFQVKKRLPEKFYNKVTMANASCSSFYSYYTEDMSQVRDIKKAILYVGIFTIFMLVISSVNIINTNAGNLYMRRQELAQLRVIGMSKKRLCRVVLLEGMITTIIANIIGCFLGFMCLFPLYMVFEILLELEIVFPAAGAVLGLVISVIVLCGSVYFPIKRMSNSVLDNLNAGGD